MRTLIPLAILVAGTASAAEYGENLEGFSYPWPLHHHEFRSQGQSLRMGYIDLKPEQDNGKTVVLMHGKNFCAATWESTITALHKAGYRVIAPDQIGFCTSSKPDAYQYSFHQLAQNTHQLLTKLNVKEAIVIGHSTGGMLATRYALMYPRQTSKLVMVNPIGLEDWKAKGVPYRTVDEWYERELKTTAASIKSYEQKTYYMGRWKPEFDKWVDMLAGLNAGPGKEKVAWNSALLYDMIYTQPVYYEFKNLRVPSTLFIGTGDTTAPGSDGASPEVQKTLGNYQVLGKEVAALIPNATLVEYPGMGHAPQMEEPDKFHRDLLADLLK